VFTALTQTFLEHFMNVVNGLTESASAAMVYPGLKFLITSDTQLAKIRFTQEAIGAKLQPGRVDVNDTFRWGNLVVPCCCGKSALLYSCEDIALFNSLGHPHTHDPLIEAVLHDGIIMLKTELDALHSIETTSCSDDAQIVSETDWKFQRYATLLEPAANLAKRKQKLSPAIKAELIRLMDSL